MSHVSFPTRELFICVRFFFFLSCFDSCVSACTETHASPTQINWITRISSNWCYKSLALFVMMSFKCGHLHKFQLCERRFLLGVCWLLELSSSRNNWRIRLVDGIQLNFVIISWILWKANRRARSIATLRDQLLCSPDRIYVTSTYASNIKFILKWWDEKIFGRNKHFALLTWFLVDQLGWKD